jgi:hypothetical protein
MAVPPIVAAKAATDAQKALTGDVYIRKWQTKRTVGKGKKKQTIVRDHEVHVNPLTVLVAGGVAAGGVLALAMGGWFMQKKLARSTEPASKFLITKQYDATVTYKTVVDTPAYKPWHEEQGPLIPGYWDEHFLTGWLCLTDGSEIHETTGIGVDHWFASHKGHDIVQRSEKTWIPDRYETIIVWDAEVPAVTHQEPVTTQAGWTLVTTLHGIPLRRIGDWVVPETVLSKADAANGWTYESIIRGPTEGEDQLGRYVLQVWKFTNANKHALALTDRKGFLE